ncbi:MAG TPA: diadenylate cyclase CdaA [Flavobacteriaceae bacterium]|nr:diadenylate cyclase CdaA [Flavobacteriaceae bacterium]MCB9213624.1 TIGR00159 family protein [Alteromonas sp.]HPF12125.1 diadenylate cyclase CdaA [Flavobacteriaceae bacterium]HQU21444.1 diadenylate cyclase CdaA [Flavobacteriaceae bacterium]HQU65594.1 diadenylate cyclase CdaA [Flavobacteriaceae bacterium]
MDILDIRIIDIVDIILVALLLYYLYKLVKGTVAINIFIGIVILYVVWKVTEFLQMEMLSRFLAGFKDIFLILIVIVFQQEIRKFLLMLGTTNVTARRKLFKRLNLFSENESSTNIPAILGACSKMGKSQTGAIIVLQRNNSLEFVKNTGDPMNVEINQPILESIFYKNSPLHDGALIIEDNTITATRVILPVSNDKNIPQRFGLRHRAALGITEKTDAVCLVVSEENGQISYIKEGDFVLFEDMDQLHQILKNDLSS